MVARGVDLAGWHRRRRRVPVLNCIVQATRDGRKIIEDAARFLALSISTAFDRLATEAGLDHTDTEDVFDAQAQLAPAGSSLA